MRLPSLVVAMAALYFVLAVAGIVLSREPGSIAVLWYANAVAIVVVVSQSVGRWPVLLGATALACVAANVAYGDSLRIAAQLASANVVEVWSGAALLRITRAHRRMIADPSRFFRFLAVGSLVPPMAGATVAALMFWTQDQEPLIRVWLSWYEGSVLGSCSLLPLGFALQSAPWHVSRRILFKAESIAFCLLAAGVALLALLRMPFPFVYLSLPLVLAAVHTRFIVVCAMVLFTSLAAGVLTSQGLFVPPPTTADWHEVLFYLPLLAAVVPPMLLSVAMEQSRGVNEARYRQLYRKTPAMLHSLDLDGHLLSVSEMWLSKLGFREEEVLGRRIVDFMTPDSRRYAIETVLPELKRTGQCKDQEFQFVARGGVVLDVLFSATRKRGESGRIIRLLAVAEDVTDKKRLAAQLAAEHELLQVTLHSIGDAVITTDRVGRVKYLNPVAQKLAGWTRAEAEDKPVGEVFKAIDEATRAPLANPVQRLLEEGQTPQGPMPMLLVSRSGDELPIEAFVSPIRAADGTLLGAVIVFHDVSQSRAVAIRMAHLAQHDALTDLPNRLLLQDRLVQAIHSAQRKQSRFALMFLDLDHFKHINDSLGHAVGDGLLRAVAQRLVGLLRESDTVCRLGGDEFVVLLGNIDAPPDAAEVAEKILRVVAEPIDVATHRIEVSLSIGIAVYPEDGEDDDTLMRHADVAMYRSKKEGRNRYRFFSRSIGAEALTRHVIERDMRRDLATGRFTVHYQPQVDVATGRIEGVEALVRWPRVSDDLMLPAEFLAVAEDSGLIVALGRQVLREACGQMRRWRESGIHPPRLALNLSSAQFADGSLVSMVTEVVEEFGLAPGMLSLELTESTLLQNAEHAQGVIGQLKAAGVRLVIDDFGAGYSSLGYLKRFEADELKIDESLTRGIENDADDLEIVSAIVSLARSLRLAVVAEGVETPRQLRLLEHAGCHLMQGNLIAPPAPANQIQALLAGGRLPVPDADDLAVGSSASHEG